MCRYALFLQARSQICLNFCGIANFSLNKNFYDLVFKVMHLDISITMVTIILLHVSIITIIIINSINYKHILIISIYYYYEL